MSRTDKAVKNTLYGLLGKLASILLSFVSRTVFIYTLSNTYLGISGLYTEILSALSFVDLGFGTALNYALYEPVAKNDTERIKKLLSFYKKVYSIIAVLILVMGIALVPFLQFIVKGAETISLRELRLYFIIYLINTVASYLTVYRYSFLNAQQNNYLSNNIDTVVNAVIVIAQIGVLLLTKNFFYYLCTQTIIILFSRIGIAFYLDKRFSILKTDSKNKLSKEEQRPIFNEVKGLAVHQFSSVAIHATDNIIISTFTSLGVVSVGLVSNYSLVMNAVLGFILIIFNSITSGFGNIVAESDTKNYRKVFLTSNFIAFWVYGFSSVAFAVLLPPFIILWIGKENLIDQMSFLLIVTNFFFQGLSTIYNNARVAKGNFNQDKWSALLQAIINLIVSIVGARKWGLVGVYVGTVVSRLVYVVLRPYTTYRFLFDHSVTEYYKKTLIYSVSTIAIGIITYVATMLVLSEVTLFTFCAAVLIVTILPNLLILLIFNRSQEFRDCIARLKGFMKEKLN